MNAWYDPHVITTPWILCLIALGFGIFESIWRRWFGGGFDYKWLKWLNFRFLKHTINIIALFSICYWVRGIHWAWALYTALMMQLCFWSLTFGMYFDIGRGGKHVTPEGIEDYNKPWFAPFLNWCFKEDQLYTPFYDFCGMMIRFTWPVLLVGFVPTFSYSIALLGEWVAFVYAMGWVLWGRGRLTKIGPTELGEFAAGFMTGVLMVLSGMKLIG